MKSSRSTLAFVLAAGLASESTAVSGPEYRSLRALSMGNAFVAVVDNKDALYYNPAGLNLINALGNPARPGLAAYPRNRFNARVNIVGMALPLDYGLDVYRFYMDNRKAFKNGSTLREDDQWLEDLSAFDRKAIEIGLMHGSEFAMHNFGAAYWMDANVAPYPDEGMLLPQAGIKEIEIDGVVQVALARGLANSQLAVGVGYRLANRRTVHEFQVAASNVEGAEESARDSLREKMKGLQDLKSYGHGADVGVLWQQTSWLRLGAAAQNLGMYLNEQFVTPELTVGFVVTPPVLATGGFFARKFNIAVDLEDLLDDERNYRFLSKVNFGAEVEQNFWKFAAVRVGGGFKGGYWAAGAGISGFNMVHIEYASWAEEAGYYTGHIEERFHAFRVGVGF